MPAGVKRDPAPPLRGLYGLIHLRKGPGLGYNGSRLGTRINIDVIIDLNEERTTWPANREISPSKS